MPRRDQDLGIVPGGRLHRLLVDPRVTRHLRRDILAVVQMPATKRRDKLERSVRRRLETLGIET